MRAGGRPHDVEVDDGLSGNDLAHRSPLAQCVGVGCTDHMGNRDDEPRWAEDDDFPEINDDTIGSVFTDKYGVTYVCIYVEAFGAYAWWPLGRASE
jgi:hypothetical protein